MVNRLMSTISKSLIAALVILAAAVSSQAQTCVLASPCTLSFSLSQGGSQTQVLAINAPAGVTWTAAVPSVFQSWLSVTPGTGTGPGQVSVTATAQSLNPGTQLAAQIIVQGGTAYDQVNVTVTVAGSTTISQIAATPSSLTFDYQAGSSAPPGAQYLIITSSTGQAINFTALASSTGWLEATPASGNTQTSNQVMVRVLPTSLTGLGVGAYDGSVTITPVGIVGATPVTVAVRLNVTGTPQLALSRTAMSFAWQRGTAAPTPPSQSVNVSVQNSTTAAYFTVSATYSPSTIPWLVLPITSSITPADIIVSVNQPALNALANGTYRATVQFTSQVSGFGSASLEVTLRISDQPLLTVNPSSLQFSVATGGALPGAQSLALSSTSTNVPFSASFVPTTGLTQWLTVSPQSGTTPVTLSVSLAAAAQTLLPGTYQGTINIQTLNETQQVPVTLTVTSGSTLTVQPERLVFLHQIGKSLPPDQFFNVTSTGTAVSFTATASSVGGWLSILNTPAGGLFTTPAYIGVRVTLAGMSPATYDGTITLTPTSGTATPVVVPVRVIISGQPLIAVSPTEVTFNIQSGGSLSASQFVSVSSTEDPLGYTVTTTVDSGFGWLGLFSPSSGTTPSNITISVNATGLPGGTYTGTVTVTPTNGTPAQTIRVKMIVTAGTLSLSPSTLSFEQTAGGAAPPAQRVTVTNSAPGAAALSFSVTATTSSGGSWLSVSPTTGSTPGELTVSVNAAGLPASDTPYTGTITVQSLQAGNSPQQISVSLRVRQALTISASPTSLSFSAQVPDSAPPSQSLQVQGSASGMTFTATATTQSGGDWLAISQTGGTLPANISVSIRAERLAVLTPGNYVGTIRIEAPNATNSPLTVNVTLAVTARAPQVLKVVNSASYLPGPVAPGELLYMEGSAMGPNRLVTATPTPAFPTTLEDVRVLFDGLAAPLVYVSDTKITAVAPWNLAGRVRTNIVVEYKGQRSSAIEMQVASVAPGIYTAAASGVGQGAILNQDYTYNGVGTGRRRARKGEIVMVYGTGGGVTSPAGIDGSITPQILHPFPASVITTASIGGVPAVVHYAGGAPGLISGAMQVNLEIPQGAPSGDNVPIVLLIGGVPTQANVTIAIE